MDRDPRCDEWVMRVLGVTVPHRAEPPRSGGFDIDDPLEPLRKQVKAGGEALKTLWSAAKERSQSLEGSETGGDTNIKSLLTETLPSLDIQYKSLTERVEQEPKTDAGDVAKSVRADLDEFGSELTEARRALKPFLIEEREYSWNNTRDDYVKLPDDKQQSRLGQVEFIEDFLLKRIKETKPREQVKQSLDDIYHAVQSDKNLDPTTQLHTMIKESQPDAIKDAIDSEMTGLEKSEKRLANYNAINPATDCLIGLRKAVEDFVTETAVDIEAGLKLLHQISVTQTGCDELLDSKRRIETTVTKARQRTQPLLNPKRREGLITRMDTLLETVRAECAKATDIGDLQVMWEESEKAAKALLKDATKAAQEKLEPAVAKSEAKQALDGYGAFLKGLPVEAAKKLIAKAALLFSDATEPPDDPEKLLSMIEKQIESTSEDSVALTELSGKLKDALSEGFSGLLESEGNDAIDKFVSELKGSATGPTVQASCAAALKKRFGVDVKFEGGIVVTQLPQLYDILKRLPPEHVGKNMRDITYSFDTGMSQYIKSNGATTPGKIEIKEAYRDSAPYLDLNEPNKQVKKQYFTMVTLHEIGHAVDDSETVMSGQMKGGDFGGWDEPDVSAVATVLYEQYFASLADGDTGAESDLRKVTEELITQFYANDKNYPGLAEKWDSIRNGEGWKIALGAGDSKSAPWRKPVLVKGDIAYHKAYDSNKNWVSYSIGNRTKHAVSTYQFRSPGEWFAEVYAVYHAGGEEERKQVRSKFGAGVIKAITGES